MIRLRIEKLPEGMYPATSGEVQGLAAQGRTIQETIEIAQDVAKKLVEAGPERGGAPFLGPRGVRRSARHRHLMGALIGFPSSG